MKTISGDLIKLGLTGNFDCIIHGCNCFCTMGAGLAAQIRRTIPSAYHVDQVTTPGDKRKLGTYTSTLVPTSIGTMLLVVNAYTQYSFNTYGSFSDLFEYSSFTQILDVLYRKYPTASFGIPAIGMERAGGDPERIHAIINEFAVKVEQAGGSVTFVTYKPS